MDSFIAIMLLVSISYVVYRTGKQTGSRHGFGAGRRSRRRRFR